MLVTADTSHSPTGDVRVAKPHMWGRAGYHFNNDSISGLSKPVGCCRLPGGGLAVADTGNKRVVIFSPHALEA